MFPGQRLFHALHAPDSAPQRQSTPLFGITGLKRLSSEMIKFGFAFRSITYQPTWTWTASSSPYASTSSSEASNSSSEGVVRNNKRRIHHCTWTNCYSTAVLSVLFLSFTKSSSDSLIQ
jgi:hypothetical protein